MNRLGIQGCKEKCPLVRTWHGSELAGLALDWTELDSFAALTALQHGLRRLQNLVSTLGSVIGIECGQGLWLACHKTDKGWLMEDAIVLLVLPLASSASEDYSTSLPAMF